MSWASRRPSSAACRVRAVSLSRYSSCFRSALSRKYPLTCRGLRCLGEGIGSSTENQHGCEDSELINGLSFDYHVRFIPSIRTRWREEIPWGLRGSFGDRRGLARRLVRFRWRQLVRPRGRFRRIVGGLLHSLLVRDASLLRHQPADAFAVRRLESEELREVPGRRQRQGSSGRFPVDQAEILEPLRVLVDLGADHVEQVALEERLVVGDQGRGLEEVPIDLRRRET